MTENKKLESENVFLNTENFSQFILKYKNNFEKRKYFQLDKNFKITAKEPSFILELGYIYFSENEKNEDTKQIISEQFLETFKEKGKKIERLSKVELPKLIDGFRRSIFNKEKAYRNSGVLCSFFRFSFKKRCDGNRRIPAKTL